MKKIKIIVTAGGGGHFSPALAVMKKLEHQADLLFIGRKYALEGDSALSLEYLTMQELDIPFATITAGRLQRTLSLRSATSLTKTPVGLYQALRILRQEKPDIVLSFGGYIALPVTLGAKMLGIPVVLHEQTMRAGLANRIAGKFAEKICLTFASSAQYFPEERTVVTGTPLREDFLHPKKVTGFTEQLPMLFVTGGSLGAHAINTLIEGTIEKLLEQYLIVHQTGDAQEYQDYERLLKLREELPETLRKRYRVEKFLKPDEMAGIFQEASLVISRAGMSTIMELLYFKKPVLFIPLPHGQRGEQQENAEFMQSLGLARVKKQRDLTSETLYTEIEEMMAELDSFTLQEDLQPIIEKNAAEKIITVVLGLAQKLSQTSDQEKKLE